MTCWRSIPLGTPKTKHEREDGGREACHEQGSADLPNRLEEPLRLDAERILEPAREADRGRGPRPDREHDAGHGQPESMCQRRVSGRPSGKRRRKIALSPTQATCSTRRTTRTPGARARPRVVRWRSRRLPRRFRSAPRRGEVPYITQPIGFSGRRAATNAPVVANTVGRARRAEVEPDRLEIRSLHIRLGIDRPTRSRARRGRDTGPTGPRQVELLCACSRSYVRRP